MKIGLYEISSWIFALILTNIGTIGLTKFPEYRIVDLALIFLGFLLVYFSSYIAQINKNERLIEELTGEFNKQKVNMESNEKLLNTLKDIIILNKVSKIK